MKENNFCSDFADEYVTSHQEEAQVQTLRTQSRGVCITHTIISKDLSNRNYRKGEYVCIGSDDFYDHEAREEMMNCICQYLHRFEQVVSKKVNKILVVGLGNRNITSDALGVLVAQKVLATSHFYAYEEEELCEGTRNVGVITPGVMGQTGIESFSIVESVVAFFKPDLVIVIDALASNHLSRMHHVVQLNTVGLAPGSGVGNHRKALNYESLHVPVLSMGVAMIMSLASVLKEVLPKECEIDLEPYEDEMITKKALDQDLQYLVDILSVSLNSYLHPNFKNL